MEIPATDETARIVKKALLLILNFSLDIQKTSRGNCLPTIVGKPVDDYRQACSQSSAGLLTIIDNKIDTVSYDKCISYYEIK